MNLALQLQQIYPLALVRRGMVYKAIKQSDLANADFEADLDSKLLGERFRLRILQNPFERLMIEVERSPYFSRSQV